MDSGSLILVVSTILVLSVSGNNISTCVGNLIGARIIGRRASLSIGAAGVALGLLLQGRSMTMASENLSGMVGPQTILLVLLATLVMFVAAHIIRIPLSLTTVLPAILAGASGAFGWYFFVMVLAWIVAPFAAILSAPLVTRLLARSGKRFWSRIEAYKASLLTLSFFSAFVLGANTIGLIVAMEGFSALALLAAVAAIALGSLFFSSGEIRRIGLEIFNLGYSNALSSSLTSTLLVEASTLAGIPMANTKLQASAIFGSGLSYKTKFFSVKPFILIVLGWTVFPVVGLLIGLSMAYL